jgi:hypothetical protein
MSGILTGEFIAPCEVFGVKLLSSAWSSLCAGTRYPEGQGSLTPLDASFHKVVMEGVFQSQGFEEYVTNNASGQVPPVHRVTVIPFAGVALLASVQVTH